MEPTSLHHDNGIDLFDEDASVASPGISVSFIAHRAELEDDGVSVHAHEYLVSDVTCIHEYLALVQSALN